MLFALVVVIVLIVIASVWFKWTPWSTESLVSSSDASNRLFGIVPRSDATANSGKRRTY